MREKIKSSLGWNVLIAAAAVAALVGLGGIAREARGLRQEHIAAEAKIAALREERARLSARIAELATPEAVEREAKEKLNLKKKGEQVVLVVPGDTTRASSSPASETWWGGIKNFFGGMF